MMENGNNQEFVTMQPPNQVSWKFFAPESNFFFKIRTTNSKNNSNKLINIEIFIFG